MRARRGRRGGGGGGGKGQRRKNLVQKVSGVWRNPLNKHQEEKLKPLLHRALRRLGLGLSLVKMLDPSLIGGIYYPTLTYRVRVEYVRNYVS